MTDFDKGELRIVEKEEELAKIQTEETIFRQLESNIMRDSLKRTLAMAAVFASLVAGMLDGFDENVDQMASDLNGHHRNDDPC